MLKLSNLHTSNSFYISMILFLTVIFLLAETTIRPLLLSITGLLLIVQIKKEISDLAKIKLNLPTILGGIFIVWQAFVSIWTHSIPASLDKILYLFIAWLIFVWGSLASKKVVLKVVPHAILTTVVILSILSLFFLIFPQYSAFLPALNVLYPNFGHTQIATALVLVLPLSWLKATNDENSKRSWLIISSFLTLMVFLSFGRVALLVAVVQLAVVVFIWGDFLKQKLAWSLGSALLLISVFLVVAVTISGFYGNKTCFGIQDSVLSVFKNQLCKPVQLEQRPVYWGIAWSSIKQFPLSGYGPGTFPIISKKFVVNQSANSTFAHNFLLETTSESGVIGGILLIGWIGSVLLIGSTQTVPKDHKKLKQAIFLGLSASLVLSMLDFSWSFAGIFFSTIFLLTTFLRLGVDDSFVQMIKASKVKPLWTIASYLFGLILVLFTISQTILSKLDPAETINFFPYFQGQQEKIWLSNNLSNAQQDRATWLYGSDPEFLYSELFKSLSSENKAKAIASSLKNNSEFGYHIFALRETLSEGDYRLAEEIADSAFNLWNKNPNNKNKYTSESREEFAKLFWQLAEHYFDEGKYQRAGVIAGQAQQIADWSLRFFEPHFSLTETKTKPVTNKDDLANYLSGLAPVNESYLGLNRSYYLQAHQQVLSEYFSEKEMLLSDEQLQTLSSNFVTLAGSDAKLLAQELQTNFIIAALRSENYDFSKKTDQWLLLADILNNNEVGQPVYSDFSVKNKLIISIKDQYSSNNEDLALSSAIVLFIIDPYDYWVSALPGYLALESGNTEKAERLFGYCQDWYNKSHFHCDYGSEYLLELSSAEVITEILQNL